MQTDRTGERNSHWKGGRSPCHDGYTLIHQPGHPRADSRSYVLEHILITETALGKPLPPKAVVHHHTPEQLVVCQNQAYHNLTHRRQRAFEACGHADWRKCWICKRYEAAEKLKIYGETIYHADCYSERRKLRRRKKLG